MSWQTVLKLSLYLSRNLSITTIERRSPRTGEKLSISRLRRHLFAAGWDADLVAFWAEAGPVASPASRAAERAAAMNFMMASSVGVAIIRATVPVDPRYIQPSGA